MTAPDPVGGREPRFAGSVPSGRMPQAPSPWSNEAAGRAGDAPGEAAGAIAYPPAPFPAGPTDPVVRYGPGFPVPDSVTRFDSRLWTPPVLAAAGGVLAAIASLFNWASLRLDSSGTDSQGLSEDSSRITYSGLSLLEGRVMLVLGIGSVVLSVLVFLRRRLTGVLVASGALGTMVVAFAAFGHPVELATLFRSYRQLGGVKVTLPNGVGVWLAMGGAVLILVGGLLAHIWRQSAGAPQESSGQQ